VREAASARAVRSVGCVIVFAKAPTPGLVKTRLCPPLDHEQAASLYQNMLDDVLEATGRFARQSDLDAVLCVHPAEACVELAARAPSNFRVIAQRGGGLAARMAWAVDEAVAGGASKILLRGSDNPTLSIDDMHAALVGLDDHDLVISPDLDGGYGLIGVRGAWSAIFDHPMSTHTVLEETLADAARLGLTVRVLDTRFDVDRAEDLERLARAVEREDVDHCARTVEWIRQNGFWPAD
jgi:rSAM/selenodomain-associated transferase 1